MYELVKTKNFIEFKNGKSIKPGGEGIYPVYGANGIIGMSNEYREGNSVIIGRVGAYCGSVQFCKGRYWASDNTIVACPKDNNTDVAFLYYSLKNANLNRWAGGAAQPLMTQTVIKQIKLPHPDIDIQPKVSSILSAYDDFIENNSRRIQILEEMARLIYQAWFVNFRFPGHENVKFVNSELGKIPEGWEVVSLGDFCYIEKNKYKDQEHSTLPLLDLARIPRKSLVINSLGSSCELKTSRIIFRKGSVLFGSIRPYFHKVFYGFCDGVTNTSVFVIKSMESVPVSFLFSLLFSEDSVNWANQNSGGTKMPVISWDVFKTMKVILPAKDILNKFDVITSHFLEEICLLNMKNLKLKQTRDLLLPKLISGELDISDLDIVIKEQENDTKK